MRRHKGKGKGGRQEAPPRYCPFKKKVRTELDGYSGRRVQYELFAECAGERCMAFQPGGCKRLQSPKD